ncbi:MAG TPA: hypothetical protein PLF38_02965 [Xylanibacter oryzae]|nr:hypothetical protein [Xylanibacter oryzae]
MLERDYIMRLTREFAAALALVLEKNEIKSKKQKLQELYNSYIGPSAFYHTASLDEVMESFESVKESERLFKMEMLAELYYAEADMETGPTRHMLLEKAFAIFSFIDSNSKTYSMDRINKMYEINKKLQ